MVQDFFHMPRVQKWQTIFCLLVLLLFVNLIATSKAQPGELYRWVDKEGNVHVTETPPDPSLCKEEVKSITAPEEAVSEKPQQPEIAVYGRDACGLTRRMKSVLDREGVPYTYGIVDDNGVHNLVKKKLKASGIDTSQGYGLPVVDVGGRIFIRPNPTEVVNMYKHSR